MSLGKILLPVLSIIIGIKVLQEGADGENDREEVWKETYPLC